MIFRKRFLTHSTVSSSCKTWIYWGLATKFVQKHETNGRKNINLESNQNSKFEIISLASVGLFRVANFVQDWSVMIGWKWHPQNRYLKFEILKLRRNRELATRIVRYRLITNIEHSPHSNSNHRPSLKQILRVWGLYGAHLGAHFCYWPLSLNFWNKKSLIHFPSIKLRRFSKRTPQFMAGTDNFFWQNNVLQIDPISRYIVWRIFFSIGGFLVHPSIQFGVNHQNINRLQVSVQRIILVTTCIHCSYLQKQVHTPIFCLRDRILHRDSKY